ncbi:lanthionine synthetase C family protein [Embleya scabrispora]|uniref:lanthionine synthetase C family protein n=1 Tax=Embleya scabrispora TaxID=159449 RepID=UPI0013751531|nr:lanthionine synthetase C family protein [Embleya scabrispora]
MTPDQALAVADDLADPTDPRRPTQSPWWALSLAHGAPGIALLHAETAAAGLRPWKRAQDWLTAAAGTAVSAAGGTGAFYGAPALAHALAAVDTARPGSYRRALAVLDTQVAAHALRRVDAAQARLRAATLPHLAEFDTLRGLAGVGAHLLRRDPGGRAVRAVLSHLVRLTEPLADEEGPVPGWWSPTGPSGHHDPEFPGGHGNAGMAHGISGVLAALSLAAVREVAVPGQTRAIDTIRAWLDAHRLDTALGARWPYLLTRAEQAAPPAPELLRHAGDRRRPSWCYGTAGIARALQMAALARGDERGRHEAETALLGAMRDTRRRALTVEGSLCHGHAGLARICARAAADADGPNADPLRAMVPELLDAAHPPADARPGLLEGAAGIALAVLAGTGVPRTGWDTCLLIT